MKQTNTIPKIKTPKDNGFGRDFGFVFKDDIQEWIRGADRARWSRIYQKKRERDYLREGKFARI